ncbi:MAG: DUF1249 domain-containing protein [Proteobacteria bacterium]|nr:DUF1249 domain-containing protein [Pseudomonadota bacterium]
MLQEYLLVPETIVKPGSFVGLMSLYESNFLRLQQLIPELYRLDGYYRSRVAGDCDLHVEILERSRYTVTMSLSYFFYEEGVRITEPDMKVRVYFDGLLAESTGFSGERGQAAFRRLSQVHRAELDARWRRNIILNKWLEYLMDQGHLVLER